MSRLGRDDRWQRMAITIGQSDMVGLLNVEGFVDACANPMAGFDISQRHISIEFGD